LEKVKDAMLVLLECGGALKTFFIEKKRLTEFFYRLKNSGTDDTRTDPESNSVLSRIALICQDMSTDIKEYYNGGSPSRFMRSFVETFFS
jgi:hypothetical protein